MFCCCSKTVSCSKHIFLWNKSGNSFSVFMYRHWESSANCTCSSEPSFQFCSWRCGHLFWLLCFLVSTLSCDPSVFLHLFLFFTWSLFMFVLPYQLIYSSQAEFLLLPPLWRRHDLKDDVLLWVCFSAWSRLQCRWWATGVGALEMQWQSVIAHVTISHTHIC